MAFYFSVCLLEFILNQREAQFFTEHLDKLDTSNRAYYNTLATSRWFGVRLELIGATITLATGMLVILQKSALHAGLAGLAISSAMQVRTFGIRIWNP